MEIVQNRSVRICNKILNAVETNTCTYSLLNNKIATVITQRTLDIAFNTSVKDRCIDRSWIIINQDQLFDLNTHYTTIIGFITQSKQ